MEGGVEGTAGPGMCQTGAPGLDLRAARGSGCQAQLPRVTSSLDITPICRVCGPSSPPKKRHSGSRLSFLKEPGRGLGWSQGSAEAAQCLAAVEGPRDLLALLWCVVEIALDL